MGEPLRWNHLVSFVLLVAAVHFDFGFGTAADTSTGSLPGSVVPAAPGTPPPADGSPIPELAAGGVPTAPVMSTAAIDPQRR